MIKRKKGKKLGRDLKHRRALFKNLARQLILHEEIKTTLAKAKALRPFVEKVVTKAKRGQRSDLLKLRSSFPYPNIIKKLVKEIGPRFKERPGGYTRILKLGPRRGDGVETAIIKFVKDE
ncbi:50S ribosomal protein L17 [candidate division CPR3 bacterium 4484_211]|uniref:Large ribosomal subunit protein bL17 n=1 Tax=candidate division CPR3 bacterium 4484_211 TaxID=1968527 RepID=A0A1W9NZ91_UNCC3|nr:MAG: 50S ribosomal protein L17 [candidate division CPR3 bacterium 4484_211]